MIDCCNSIDRKMYSRPDNDELEPDMQYITFNERYIIIIR